MLAIDWATRLGTRLLGRAAGGAAQRLMPLRRRRSPAQVVPVAPPPVDRRVSQARALDQAHEAALQQACAGHAAALAEAERRIAAAAACVRETGLAFMVPWLWEERAALACLPDAELAADGLHWHWAEARWQLALQGERPDRATLALTRDGAEVLALACVAEGGRWRFVSVGALVAGPWMAELVDFAGQVRTALELARARRAAAPVLDAAARIRLERA